MNNKVKVIVFIVCFIIAFVVTRAVLENVPTNKNENEIASIDNENKNTKNEVDTSFKGGEVIAVNSSNFEQEVLKSDKKVLIDFYADWCGPCQMLSPLIDEVAEEYSDVKFVRIDVDANEDLSNQYGVVYIPKLVVIENGIVINESVGYIEKNEIENLIK